MTKKIFFDVVVKTRYEEKRRWLRNGEEDESCTNRARDKAESMDESGEGEVIFALCMLILSRWLTEGREKCWAVPRASGQAEGMELPHPVVSISMESGLTRKERGERRRNHGDHDL